MQRVQNTAIVVNHKNGSVRPRGLGGHSNYYSLVNSVRAAICLGNKLRRLQNSASSADGYTMQCASCGGTMRLEEGKEYLVCDYCKNIYSPVPNDRGVRV